VTAPTVAVVLAAGKGTRMRSERPKVLHEAGGRPLLSWVLDAARAAGCTRTVVVVGHGADEVRARYADRDDLDWVGQEPQLGTGHALLQARAAVAGPARLVVLSGDVPLVRAETIQALLDAADGADGAMAVAVLDAPGSLGRVLTEGGRLVRIVEAVDASPEELEIRRVNAGLYALAAPAIFDEIEALESDNAQGELYLTDAVTAVAARGSIAVVELADPAEATGVNDRVQLAAAHGRLLDRRRRRWMEAGVTLLVPERIEIGPEVELAEDVVIHPDVTLDGRTRVGRGAVLHQGVWIRDCEIGSEVEILPYSVLVGARLGVGARVGPFARLRPGAELERGARVGNFVELKNARLGAGAKASHLAYIGDADVGEGANVGAGAVTCNYDGERKHRTTIGPGAFVGSDTMLVAPVTVGEGATTGAGSVITKDVPAGALGINRGRQRNLPAWRDRRRRRDDPTLERDEGE